MLPLLILAGELDDWTPAKECVSLAGERRHGQGLPGCTTPSTARGRSATSPSASTRAQPGGRGATTEGNAEAWADSIRQVDAFFAKDLKR
jgi:hypothetical protein